MYVRYIKEKNRPETVYLAADAHLIRNRRGYAWEVWSCPICGERHVHGGVPYTEDPRRYVSYHRVHCRTSPSALVEAAARVLHIDLGGYILTDANGDRTDCIVRGRPVAGERIEPHTGHRIVSLAAPARLAECREMYLWQVAACPICGKKHQHGAGRQEEDPRRSLFDRVRHCYEKPTAEMHAAARVLNCDLDGYILVDADADGTDRYLRQREAEERATGRRLLLPRHEVIARVAEACAAGRAKG